MNIDDFYGGYLAGEFFCKTGHTLIGFASSVAVNNPIISQRLLGFRTALQRYNINLPSQYVFTYPTCYDGGILTADEIFSQKVPPTAVFATVDEMGVGIINRAHQLGYSIPDDLSVIGFDDTPVCSYVHPSLTTISQDIKRKAEEAVSMLMEILSGSEEVPKKQIILPVNLIERHSTK